MKTYFSNGCPGKDDEMKIIIIEADAEELRADRTLEESIRAALYRAVEAFGARTDTAAEDESEEEYEENAVEEPDHERVKAR